jgi:hypothetical protein
MSAGDCHAAVVTAHGTALLWGSKRRGCCGREYPDDVAIHNAACGCAHTILVTRSGRLFVFGDNSRGQLAMAASDKPFMTATPVHHPTGGRFVSAEAGNAHSILLDSSGDVFVTTHSGLKCLLQGRRIIAIAAGGDGNAVAIASSPVGTLTRQFSVDSVEDGCMIIDQVENLLEEMDSDSADKVSEPAFAWATQEENGSVPVDASSIANAYTPIESSKGEDDLGPFASHLTQNTDGGFNVSSTSEPRQLFEAITSNPSSYQKLAIISAFRAMPKKYKMKLFKEQKAALIFGSWWDNCLLRLSPAENGGAKNGDEVIKMLIDLINFTTELKEVIRTKVELGKVKERMMVDLVGQLEATRAVIDQIKAAGMDGVKAQLLKAEQHFKNAYGVEIVRRLLQRR